VSRLNSKKDIATMKKPLSSLFASAVLGALALGAAPAMAQDAGTVMVKLGYNQIVPQVTSGDLSAPSLAGTKIDVKEDGAPIFTLTYMYTSDISFEMYAGLPYEHEVVGDGAIKGVGKIGSVKQVSPTLFAQYRFLEKESMVRPYVGLGLTYAYFYGEEGSGTLTALTNPGGDPTRMEVDAAWGLSPQLGATIKIDRNWFVDVSVVKSYVKTTSHLSTGQSIETKLDPLAYNLSIGYRF
jgi:outer membrane protein